MEEKEGFLNGKWKRTSSLPYCNPIKSLRARLVLSFVVTTLVSCFVALVLGITSINQMKSHVGHASLDSLASLSAQTVGNWELL